MKPTHPQRLPKYRRQKGVYGDRAFVELNGVRHYLGDYGTSESKAAYDRAIAQWMAAGRSLSRSDTATITIKELLAGYWVYVEGYYRTADGHPTSEVQNTCSALRPLKALYGDMPAADFGPKSLKAVRQKMVDDGGSRLYINKHIGRVKRAFKWAVGEELIPPSVYHGLQAVAGLKRGRCEARETDPVRPAPDHLIEGIRPFLSRQVSALIDLQLLTGARCGELFHMRAIDLYMSETIWIYRPESHKTAHLGRDRAIYLGPKAQTVVTPFLSERPVHLPLFSPKEAEYERRQEMHEQRKTPPTYGNSPGTNRRSRPERAPGDAYGRDGYRRAIARACIQAFPAPDGLDDAARRQWQKDHSWHPHQLGDSKHFDGADWFFVISSFNRV